MIGLLVFSPPVSGHDSECKRGLPTKKETIIDAVTCCYLLLSNICAQRREGQDEHRSGFLPSQDEQSSRAFRRLK